MPGPAGPRSTAADRRRVTRQQKTRAKKVRPVATSPGLPGMEKYVPAVARAKRRNERARREARRAARARKPTLYVPPKLRKQLREGTYKLPPGRTRGGISGEAAKTVATVALTPPSFKALSVASKGAKVIRALGKAKAAKGVTKVAPKTVAKAKRLPKIPPRAQGPVKKALLAGAIAAEPHSRRFVKRHVEATAEDPGKVFGTTARAAPGIVTAPAGIAVNVGITGARIAKEGPTKHALEPTVETGKSIAKFTKDVSKIATSKSDKEAKDLIKKDYGLTGLMIAAPAARIAAKPKGLKPLKEHEAKTPVGRYAARRRGRRDVSRMQAEERVAPALAIHRETKATVREATKAPKKRGGVKVRPQDLLGTFMEEGLAGPNKVVIDRIRTKYRKEYRNEPELRQHAENLLTYLEDPKAWQGRKAKPLAKAVVGAREVGGKQRLSETARLNEFQKTHGLRNIPEITEQILEQQTGRVRRKATGKVAVSKNVRRSAERQAVRIARKEVDKVRKEFGLAEPEKFGHVPAIPVKPATARSGAFPQTGKKGHKIKLGEGSLAAQGRVARTGEALVKGTIATPKLMQASSRFVVRSLDRGVVKNGRTVTQAEAARRMRSDEFPEGTVVFVPHTFKSAIRQMDPKKMEDGLREMKDYLEADWTKLEAAGTKGPKGSLVEKSVAEEMFKQVTNVESELGRLATKTSRGISRAILYNPAWAVGQVPATLATAAFVSANLPRGLRGIRQLKKKDPEAAERLFAAAGKAPRAAGFEREALRATPESVGMLGRAADRMRRNRIGRGALHVLDSPGEFNAWTEGYIRTAGLSEALFKQVRGPLARMRKLRRNHRALYEQMRGKTKAEQLKILSENRKLLDEIVADTGPVIGEFGRLTRSGKLPESAIAPLAIFYPFMRMSVNFLTHGLPVKHPIKSGISYHLAQWNADELKKFLGGDPSFFTEWSTLLLRTGEKGKIKTVVPFQRIAPGGSFLPEAIGEVAGGGAVNVLRALNPAWSAIVAGATGVDPLTNKQVSTKGLDRAKLALSVAGGSPAPLRAIAALVELDRKNILSKKDQTALTQLFNKLSPKQEKLIRGYAPIPAWPKDAEKAKDMARAGRAMRALTKAKEAKDAGDQAKASAGYDRGYGILNELYEKYGLAEKAGREKKAYFEKRYGKPSGDDLLAPRSKGGVDLLGSGGGGGTPLF